MSSKGSPGKNTSPTRKGPPPEAEERRKMAPYLKAITNVLSEVEEELAAACEAASAAAAARDDAEQRYGTLKLEYDQLAGSTLLSMKQALDDHHALLAKESAAEAELRTARQQIAQLRNERDVAIDEAQRDKAMAQRLRTSLKQLRVAVDDTLLWAADADEMPANSYMNEPTASSLPPSPDETPAPLPLDETPVPSTPDADETPATMAPAATEPPADDASGAPSAPD